MTPVNILFLLLVIITAGAGYFINRSWKKIKFADASDEINEVGNSLKSLYIIAAVLLILLAGYYVAVYLNWESHVLEWLTLIIRWAHVVLGIAWIGASFYFIFLENSLNRTEDLRDELAGNLWAIHGGGFYYLEKYKGAPKELPKTLHWFKYEAYFTWLTGMILMTMVYYFNAKAVMIDPSISTISSKGAIVLGSSTMVISWFIYDFLCRTSLLQKKKLFAIVGFSIVTGISFFLSHFLSGRAAFMHVGGVLGTLMAGNVFFVIIPAQKAMVAAAKKGEAIDPELGKYAGLRSLHNNYITLPVIFIMISNHFPLTYGHAFNWIVLAILTIGSVAVRHYINLHEKGTYARWMLPFAAIALIALVIITAPESTKINSAPVKFATVQPIFQKHCVGCHSVKPTDEVEKIAPNGIMFDTPEQIQLHAERINVRAVLTKTMPQGNKTGITEKERSLIGAWVQQGAPIN
jgi:uncharacterized membrane protein